MDLCSIQYMVHGTTKKNYIRLLIHITLKNQTARLVMNINIIQKYRENKMTKDHQ